MVQLSSPTTTTTEEQSGDNKQRQQQISAVQQYQQHAGYETDGAAARNRIFGLLEDFTR